MAKGGAKNKPANNRGGGRNGAAKRDTRFNQRAQANVELQDQSQINLLQQQLQEAQQDYLRERQAAQSIWGGGGEAIADMQRPQFDRIGQEFNQAAGSYADLFGGVEGMPGAEVDAGNALGLAYGDATHGMLANLDAREGLARSSASRQMDLAGRYAGDNVIQRMEDTIRGYNDQLGQVRADDPWQISQESQTLRDQALQEQLARSKMQGDRAFSEWLQGYVGGGVGGGGGAGGGGGSGGPTLGGQFPTASGGTTGVGPGTVSHAGIDNAGAYPGGVNPHPNRAIAQQVAAAPTVNDLPGWVRYAFNNEGAQSLQRPNRRQLYRKLEPRLERRFGPRDVPVDVPPGPFGF